MARINIEDRLFKDKRWTKLIVKTGCEHKALGILCGAWILSQANWLKHKSIPKKAWPEDFNVLIECELANVRSDGSVYVKGSKRAFTWLEQKSSAGQKSTEKKVEALKKARNARWNKEDLTLNGIRTDSERNVNGSEPPTPSLTLTPTLYSNSTSDSNLNTGTSTEPQLELDPTSKPKSASLPKLACLWNEHCGKLAKVKNSNPSRDKKIKAVWSRQSEAEWIETIKRIAVSDFCNGVGSRNGWKATFDFLTQPETYLKVNEGKYDNRGKKSNVVNFGYERNQSEEDIRKELGLDGTL